MLTKGTATCNGLVQKIGKPQNAIRQVVKDVLIVPIEVFILNVSKCLYNELEISYL